MPLSTQLILTGTDLYWKDRIEEKRKEWKSKKEADKKEKEEQKRAQEIARKKRRNREEGRTIKDRTFFTVSRRYSSGQDKEKKGLNSA